MYIQLSAVGKVVLEFDDSDETRATDEDCGAIINYEIADVSICSIFSYVLR